MFTAKELHSLDRQYFKVRFVGCYCVTLQSKNTGHIWSISHEEIGRIKHCIIHHKHKDEYPFHLQCNARNLDAAISKIKDHDIYHLERKNKKFSH